MVSSSEVLLTESDEDVVRAVWDYCSDMKGTVKVWSKSVFHCGKVWLILSRGPIQKGGWGLACNTELKVAMTSVFFPTDSSSDILEFISCSAFSWALDGPMVASWVYFDYSMDRNSCKVRREQGICWLWHENVHHLPSLSATLCLYGFVCVVPHTL